MRNTHFRTEIWRGKLKKVENLEMSTVGSEYGKKTENHGKWETSTWRTWKWRKSLKTEKWEMQYPKDLEYGEKLKITENEKYTL